MDRRTGPPNILQLNPKRKLPLRRAGLALVGVFVVVTSAYGATTEDYTPWRLQSASGMPSWLSVSGSFRLRFENLSDQFRANGNGSDQALALRTTLKSELLLGRFSIGGELLDSRVFENDSGSPVSTGLINAAELLQAYVKWTAADLLKKVYQ